MPKIFKSKKFWMAVTGIIVIATNEYMPTIDQEALTKIIYLIIAAILGQGMADLGKEAK